MDNEKKMFALEPVVISVLCQPLKLRYLTFLVRNQTDKLPEKKKF